MRRTGAGARWHLTSRVLLLTLVAAGLAFGLLVMQERTHPAPLLLFNLLADSIIGLFMGLGCRALLRRRPWLLRALVAAALSIVGLAFLGGVTGSSSGIGPIRFDMVDADWFGGYGLALRLPALPRNNPTDAIDAAHMLIAVDVSWMALRAWNKHAGAVGRPLSASSASQSQRGPVGPAAPPLRATSNSAPPSATAHARSRPMVKPLRASAAVARPIGKRSLGLARRRAGLLRRRPAVQIATIEEHRCPYCLQDISRADGRGSVECPVCHTLHHKDCWDITGTCQVPHLNG